MPETFPFSAIVGQDDMKMALLLNAIDRRIGGVLIFGTRGTGKSTAVRALANLLPPLEAIEGCPIHAATEADVPEWASLTSYETINIPTPVVDLPLGASEDRVTGALDIEKALSKGEKAFQPGLLAEANRGFLYIDEINLLEDHIIDLLLDVAQSGENLIERDGLSIRHAASFVLIGSGNPEEGELRPQLLDRFGLAVDVGNPNNIQERVEVLKRRDAFDQNPRAFLDNYHNHDMAIRERIIKAQALLKDIKVPDEALTDIANLCMTIGSDGLRGELTLLRSARAQAAWCGDEHVTREHITTVAGMALQHRLRRDPLDEASGLARVQRSMKQVFG